MDTTFIPLISRVTWVGYETYISFTVFNFEFSNSAAFTFHFSLERKIQDTKLLLLSNLQDIATSNIFFPVLTTLMSYLKSFVPQCSTMYLWLFDIAVCMYELTPLEVGASKYLVAALLASSIKSYSFTSLTIESAKLTVTRIFSCTLSCLT